MVAPVKRRPQNPTLRHHFVAEGEISSAWELLSQALRAAVGVLIILLNELAGLVSCLQEARDFLSQGLDD